MIGDVNVHKSAPVRFPTQMPRFLDYFSPPPGKNASPLLAMIFGFSCGPVGFGLAYISVENYLSDNTKMYLALAAFIVTMGGAFVYAWRTTANLDKLVDRRQHLFATIGMAAAVIWGVITFIYLSLFY